MIPRQGEQSPVEIISYMGYSPPKCTCHDKQSHPSNYMNLLECLHDQSHVPSPHRLPHTCLSQYASNISSFQNKSFLFLKTHYRVSVKYWTTLRGEFLDISPKQSWAPLRDELLDNSPRQFFGKSSIEIPFTNVFVFVSFHVIHSHLIF